MNQASLFEDPLLIPDAIIDKKNKRSGTYHDNMRLPVHRWFRFSAGYSAEWVVQTISNECEKSDQNIINVLDPFAGSGTTLLAADECGVKSVGYEAQPFIRSVAEAKLAWDVDPNEYKKNAYDLLQQAKKLKPSVNRMTNNPLLSKCFREDIFLELESLRIAYMKIFSDSDSIISRLIWLTITSIMRQCSHVGTAQWQYVLPNKSKAKFQSPYFAFTNKINEIYIDINIAKNNGWISNATVIPMDARDCDKSDSNEYSIVITSPPYPNNYDYADSARLEMTFWGDISGWSDLHQYARKDLVRSCSQHSAKEKLDLDELLNNQILNPIINELADRCYQLAEIRKHKGGKKTYHTMAAAYFSDLALIFRGLRARVIQGGTLCFVIGDSAPYGIHLPVEQWLGQLAVSAGFQDYNFEKIRDRNIKWKNRKHRVPLHEGRLWITA